MPDGTTENRLTKPRIAIPEPCATDPEYSAQALPPYVHAIEESGGEAVVIPLDLTPEDLARRISGCSAVLLPGSRADVDPQKFSAQRHPRTAPADPKRDAADELLLQDAYNLRKPIFGICYGLQSLNVWRTGSLVQDIESKIAHSGRPRNEMAHQVVVEPNSLLARDIGRGPCPCSIPVNSSHHQAVELVGDGLRVTARCPEDGIIEAVEGTSPDHYVLAVQWHPERSFDTDSPSQLLFRSFVEATRRWGAGEENTQSDRRRS